MNRRDLFGRLGAVAAAVALAPAVGVAAACTDCERVFSQAFTVPEAFDSARSADYVEMARRSAHELATREGISHDEAGLRVWWQALPSYTVEAGPEFTADDGALYVRGTTVLGGDLSASATDVTVTAWWDGAEGQSLRGFRT